jgi:hypothetical protein
MKAELSLAVMAGIVLSLFLIVGEIAALRKHVAKVRRYMWDLYRAGRFLRLLGVMFGISAFFLVQPLIVALLVITALDGLVPGFSGSVIRQLREALMAMMN